MVRQRVSNAKRGKDKRGEGEREEKERTEGARCVVGCGFLSIRNKRKWEIRGFVAVKR